MMLSAPPLTSRALSTTFFMSPGARNWPFLMLTGLPQEATAWMKSVCRHRKAGVCSTSTTAATWGTSASVHVGEDRHADALTHLGEDLEALLHAHAAEGLAGAAVGLVVARLVDEGNRQLGADVLERRRGFEGHFGTR
jgi:hypothetical protein